MNLTEYQQKANETAIYEERIVYPTFGLSGEIGEFYEKVLIQSHLENECIKEAGDVCWYIAALCTDFGWNMQELDKVTLIKSLEDSKLKYLDKVIIASSKISEIVKKSLRDTNKIIKEDKKEEIKIFLSYILRNLKNYMKFSFNVSLEKILVTNIEKLTSRKERNLIQGSGDNR